MVFEQFLYFIQNKRGVHNSFKFPLTGTPTAIGGVCGCNCWLHSTDVVFAGPPRVYFVQKGIRIIQLLNETDKLLLLL